MSTPRYNIHKIQEPDRPAGREDMSSQGEATVFCRQRLQNSSPSEPRTRRMDGWQQAAIHPPRAMRGAAAAIVREL